MISISFIYKTIKKTYEKIWLHPWGIHEDEIQIKKILHLYNMAPPSEQNFNLKQDKRLFSFIIKEVQSAECLVVLYQKKNKAGIVFFNTEELSIQNRAEIHLKNLNIALNKELNWFERKK